jgi:hypothetical protein
VERHLLNEKTVAEEEDDNFNGKVDEYMQRKSQSKIINTSTYKGSMFKKKLKYLI